MDDVALARALHVLAVVHWIGGVGFVTTIALPLALRRGSPELFEAVERRFAGQARVSVPFAGVTGLWMVWRLDLWHRLFDLDVWWMPSMLGLWLVFMLMLFVVEPLLHPWFEQLTRRDARRALGTMIAVHVVLLLAAGATILGAVAGAHGGWF